MTTCDDSLLMASQFDPRPYSVRHAEWLLYSTVKNKDRSMRIRRLECLVAGNKDCPCYAAWKELLEQQAGGP